MACYGPLTGDISRVAEVLNLAGKVSAACRDPAEFRGAVTKADVLYLELKSYQILVNDPQSPVNKEQGTRTLLDSRLEACSSNLENIHDIRGSYEMLSMSILNKVKWSRDGKKFHKAVTSLSKATDLFKEALLLVKARATRPSCWNGAGCRTPDCSFTHPHAPDCRNGVSCRNPACPFKHPRVLSCHYGAKCKKDDCKFTHPAKSDCRYGAKCRNGDCKFTHPAKSDCRYGAKCKEDDCKFTHPVKSDCRYGAKCKEDDCKFTHPAKSAMSDCEYTHPELRELVGNTMVVQ